LPLLATWKKSACITPLADTTLSSLEWLEANLGKRTLLSSIDNEKVAFLVARRLRRELGSPILTPAVS
jgi:hypothetical protein